MEAESGAGDEREPAALLAPITCVAVVMKRDKDGHECCSREEVGSLPHAVATISAYLDYGCAPFWTISRACEHNFMRLLRRLTSRESVDMNVHYRAHLSSKGLVCAVRNDNMEMVQWLCSTYCPSGFVWKGVEEAAAVGSIAMLEWLTQHRSYRFVDPLRSLIDIAAKHGHFEALKWIHKHVPDALYNADFVARMAIANGDRELVKWVQARSHMKNLRPILPYAVKAGDIAMAQVFFDQGERIDNEDAFYFAAESGSLEMVRWVSTHCKIAKTSCAMAAAARHGHLDIVQWLHAHRSQVVWQGNAMDIAACQGHLDILLWLHVNRSEGCTRQAMDGAVTNSHLEVMKWLNENRADDIGCEWTRDVRNCSLEVLVWLIEKVPLEFGTGVMDAAASNNQLDVVKWMHTNRSEGCTHLAMDKAAMNGHLEMVQWLHENRSEGCTAAAMENAAERGEFEIVLYLHAHRTEHTPRQAAVNAANALQLEIFQWLCETYPDQVDVHTLADNYYFLPTVKRFFRHLGISKRARPL